jgi:hypothetical protein
LMVSEARRLSELRGNLAWLKLHGTMRIIVALKNACNAR